MALCNLTIFNTVEQLRDIETGCCVQQAHQVPRAYICNGCQSAGKVTTRKQKEQLIYQQTCNDALRLACLLRSSRLIEASNYHMTIGWLDAWIGKVVQQQQSRAKPKHLLDYDQSRHWTDLRSSPLDRSTGPCTGPDLSCGPVDRISTGVQWTVH
jgi:hypothetical protein